MRVAVDLPAAVDGPQPADEEAAEDPLNDSEDKGLLLDVTTSLEASEDNTDSTEEDSKDESDQARCLIKFDSADFFSSKGH